MGTHHYHPKFPESIRVCLAVAHSIGSIRYKKIFVLEWRNGSVALATQPECRFLESRKSRAVGSLSSQCSHGVTGDGDKRIPGTSQTT